MALRVAEQSTATRHQVGAVVVTPTGMISLGWNGMPSGLGNSCEDTVVYDPVLGRDRPKSNAEVIHAERNAIDKMTRQGTPTQGSVLFVTRAPCFECAKALHGLGFESIRYIEDHDDMRGVALLRATGNKVVKRDPTVGEFPEIELNVLDAYGNTLTIN
jgi:dCMP deaminase